MPAFHFVEAKLLRLWVVLLKALDLQKEMVKQSQQILIRAYRINQKCLQGRITSETNPMPPHRVHKHVTSAYFADLT